MATPVSLDPFAGLQQGLQTQQQMFKNAFLPQSLQLEQQTLREQLATSQQQRQAAGIELQQAEQGNRLNQALMRGAIADMILQAPEGAREGLFAEAERFIGEPIPPAARTEEALRNAADIKKMLKTLKPGKPSQTVESAIVKDSQGNLYSVRTDTTGQTQYAPMSPGAPAQPVGPVSMVSKSTALTPEEGLELAGKKAGAVAEAKKQVELDFAGRIEEAKVTARENAKSLGTAVTDYQLAQAALPELQQVVNRLRALAPLATSTRAGRAWDTLRKELGFKASEGATARARYIAIINNQVLPLLKQTFGGAFTEAEGAKLEATLGDPNASPDEKIAQLDEFIQSKIRSLETGAREIQIMGGEVPASNIQKYRDMYEQIQDPAERRKFIEQAPQNILDAMGLSR